MEKTYEALAERIKKKYLGSCFDVGFAEAYDYNGAEYDECEKTNFAYGQLSSYEALIKSEGIIVSKEEAKKSKEKGRQAYLEENQE